MILPGFVDVFHTQFVNIPYVLWSEDLFINASLQVVKENSHSVTIEHSWCLLAFLLIKF